jgi:hypothetical protein
MSSAPPPDPTPSPPDASPQEPVKTSPPKPSPYARPGRPGSLGEIFNAGRGALALAALRPDWTSFYDLTPGGFIRSFFGPAIALPLYVFGAGLVARNMAGTANVPITDLWIAGAAHVLDAAAFPALIALLASPLQIAKGYGAFIVVTNWASLFLNAILAAASLLAFAGADGLEGFRLISLVVLCVWIFFTWRSARLLLTKEIAPVLLIVVLSIAIAAFADAAADWVIKAL